jgi:uncharacterized membrane protein
LSCADLTPRGADRESACFATRTGLIADARARRLMMGVRRSRRVVIMGSAQSIAQFLTAVFCGLFAGASLYINLVEHPARMECGVELAATEFPPSYRRATYLQASLAALGLICSVVAWLAGASASWLVGGVLLGSVIPFTLAVMLPTNKQLTDPSLDRGSERAARLLSRWGRLHWVRSGLSLLALVIFIRALVAG